MIASPLRNVEHPQSHNARIFGRVAFRTDTRRGHTMHHNRHIGSCAAIYCPVAGKGENLVG